MKKLITFYFCFIYCLQFSQAQLVLTPQNSYVLTPNETDTIGAFARIFYHPTRNKFYLIYAARQAGSTTPAGVLSNFAWSEYDNNMNYTGNKGILPGFSFAGDYAIVMVDSNYYHLTLATPSTNYKLTKFDDDFNIIDSIIINIHPCSSNIDQLMNYANGRLIIGAMYEASECPPTNPPNPAMTPYSEIFQYDLNLNPIANPIILSPSKVTWGSSVVYNSGCYYEVTMDNFNNRDLYAYKYDLNFNYLGSKLLHSDGQWSQGVIWEPPFYYVAHHTGEHNTGNVILSVYDVNWDLVSSVNVTNYPVLSTPGISYNANRPFIQKIGSLIYVSFDVESYKYIASPPPGHPENQKNWQAHVSVYQINNISGMNNSDKGENLCSLYVYPNPFSTQTNIYTEKTLHNATLLVYNQFGQTVSQIDNLSGNIINYNNNSLSNGIYFVRLIDENKIIAKHRFIIIN